VQSLRHHVLINMKSVVNFLKFRVLFMHTVKWLKKILRMRVIINKILTFLNIVMFRRIFSYNYHLKLNAQYA